MATLHNPMKEAFNNSPQTSDTQWVFCKTTRRKTRSHRDRVGDAEYSAWFRAQARVRSWLLNQNIPTKAGGYCDPFDLKTDDGVRIEVKASGASIQNGVPTWRFNIHRHGLLREDGVDVYVLRCEMSSSLRSVFGSSAIHLVLPAPIGVKTVAITPRALMTRWGHAFNNIEQITRRSL